MGLNPPSFSINAPIFHLSAIGHCSANWNGYGTSVQVSGPFGEPIIFGIRGLNSITEITTQTKKTNIRRP